jgi:hypothetical protein
MGKMLGYPKDFKFDLVLHDYTIGPCLLGVLAHFDYYPPVVSVTAFSIPPFSNALIGGHKYPAYIPFYSLNYDVKMSFWQRCVNTFMYSADSMWVVNFEKNPPTMYLFGFDFFLDIVTTFQHRILTKSCEATTNWPTFHTPESWKKTQC